MSPSLRRRYRLLSFLAERCSSPVVIKDSDSCGVTAVAQLGDGHSSAGDGRSSGVTTVAQWATAVIHWVTAVAHRVTAVAQ